MNRYRVTYRLGTAFSEPLTLPPFLAIDTVHACTLACREIGRRDVVWLSVEVIP